MQQRLSDIDRTLLSAFYDGELSAADRERAERLLAGSEDARGYLADLRTLNRFSNETFPAIPIGDIAGSAAASKLSSSAIRSAAGKGALAKVAGVGPWGFAGLGAVTAAVVIAFSLSSNEPRIDSKQPVTEYAVSTSPGPAVGVRQASVDLDSSALIVPAITRADLIDFAVRGQIPIDQKRECFVTVAPDRQGELSIRVHRKADRSPAIADGDLKFSDGAAIDSMCGAVRTSLLQSSGNNIAVRYDIPALRLKVLNHLQEASSNVPPQVQTMLTQTRTELTREWNRVCQEFGADRPSSPAVAESAGGQQVRYLVISGNEGQGRQVTFELSTPTSSSSGPDLRTVQVSSQSLGLLQAQARTSSRFAGVDLPAPVGARRDVQVRKATYTRATAPRIVEPQRKAAEENEERSIHNYGSTNPWSNEMNGFLPRRGTVLMNARELDSLLRATERILRNSEVFMQRIDSIRTLLRSGEPRQVVPRSPEGSAPPSDSGEAPFNYDDEQD